MTVSSEPNEALPLPVDIISTKKPPMVLKLPGLENGKETKKNPYDELNGNDESLEIIEEQIENTDTI
jgi:hypothetical protein